MINDLQKMGGVAALIQAAAYVVGFGLALTLLAPVLDADPDQYVAFLVDNLTLMHIWHLIIYLVAGVFLVVLALHERFEADSSAMAQTVRRRAWVGIVTLRGGPRVAYVKRPDQSNKRGKK